MTTPHDPNDLGLGGPTPDSIAWRLAKTTYVVLVKDDQGRLTLIADPGMNQPWHSQNKRFADTVASECDGMAATWEDAFKLLLKDNPKFEHQLHERIAKKAKIMDAEKMKQQAILVGNILKGQNVKLPEIPKNDVNPINPQY